MIDFVWAGENVIESGSICVRWLLGRSGLCCLDLQACQRRFQHDFVVTAVGVVEDTNFLWDSVPCFCFCMAQVASFHMKEPILDVLEHGTVRGNDIGAFYSALPLFERNQSSSSCDLLLFLTVPSRAGRCGSLSGSVSWMLDSGLLSQDHSSPSLRSDGSSERNDESGIAFSRSNRSILVWLIRLLSYSIFVRTTGCHALENPVLQRFHESQKILWDVFARPSPKCGERWTASPSRVDLGVVGRLQWVSLQLVLPL